MVSFTVLPSRTFLVITNNHSAQNFHSTTFENLLKHPRYSHSNGTGDLRDRVTLPSSHEIEKFQILSYNKIPQTKAGFSAQ